MSASGSANLAPPVLKRKGIVSRLIQAKISAILADQGVKRFREDALPSFDIVSRIDLAEVDNALAGMNREIATRFDFKGSKCSIERKEGALSILADDDLKLKQMHELLKVHMTRRKVEPA